VVREGCPGSSPGERTMPPGGRLHADVAQRLAHHLAKVRVASSNLVICSHAVVSRSHAVLAQWQRHRAQVAGDRGSNPRDGTQGERTDQGSGPFRRRIGVLALGIMPSALRTWKMRGRRRSGA
jgi:broad specificity phosphatase PhoE